MVLSKFGFCAFLIFILPGIAFGCETGHPFSKPVHVEPGASQQMVILRQPDPDGCKYVLEIRKAGYIILRTSIVTGNRNSPPPSMHLIGKSTNAIEFDISLVHVGALNRDLDEILIYEWKTNADAGASDLRMFGYFKGGLRRLLDLWELPGEMSYRMADGVLHVSGDMTASCMVCGKPKSLTLGWNNRLGGFTLLHPADHAYAKYLGYDLPGDGVSFSYSSVVSQYRHASASLLEMYHKAYDPADQTGREKLRRAEIAWIEEKRSICGHQKEALEPGNLAIAECLIRKTASRSFEIESDTEGAQ